MNLIRTSVFVLFALLLAACASPEPQEPPRSPAFGANGMVVSANPEATAVGLQILQEGGNAFDAAIAVKYMLSVTYPIAGNIGGGGFMVYRTAAGEVGSLDFRETAPAAAHRDMYLDEEGNLIDGLSRIGHLSAGVPGTVAGMEEAWERFGSLPFAQLIEPAIQVAENGHRVTAFNAEQSNRFQDEFAEVNRAPILFMKEGGWQEGDLLVQPELAETLRRIRDGGAAGFYTGETADLIVAEMQAGGGIITHEDLAAYRAVWRPTVSVDFGDYRIHSMPPSSSGGIAIAQLMLGSADFDFASLGHLTPETIHLMAELMRRVYADRATHLGDSDFFDVPFEMLLDPAYISARNADISMSAATPSSLIKEGEVERIESFETTHFSIVDGAGNAVSLTTTVNSFFGSKVMVQGAGFFLNNEMDDFAAAPGVPNQFGLVGGEANAIEPGKRMLSSMSPTIVERGGELFLVLGTPGGSTIITNVYQVLMNLLVHGLDLQQAVDAKKMHAQWLPDVITLEEGALDEAGQAALEALGHELRIIPQIGRMQAIQRLGDGSFKGVADYTRTGDSVARGF
ncbi:gamma-glutamyltranspeptidase / glutathione hydrolase [Cyclonatronum proteinivorum]|uniref:Glutathione hydrolase proenzyme n=1 Tax=Cyclonatronum proteinivorum TaxID=1457365 RepID=A0A345UNN1_9BACT|nr:gamma-glutamyltransferase [Cyclonatronum proteinivorum]AXJ02083.1 gamma-glutamyltranspeptidase / glutathione hydrolase [Cyclonatronum proteinivorum]